MTSEVVCLIHCVTVLENVWQRNTPQIGIIKTLAVLHTARWDTRHDMTYLRVLRVHSGRMMQLPLSLSGSQRDYGSGFVRLEMKFVLKFNKICCKIPGRREVTNVRSIGG